MKKIKQNYLSSMIIAAVFLSSCGGLNKMVDNANSVTYDVTPSPLVTNAGQVEVTIKTTFPEKYFNKKAVVVATPVLKYEGGQVAFEPTTLQGESVEANNKVIPYAGGNYTYTGKVAYNDSMLKSELVVEMSASIKDKAPVPIPGIKIADGVIATSTLVENDPKTVLVGDKFQRVIPQDYTAQILYLINRAEVRNNQLKKEDIKDLQDKIKQAVADSNKVLKNADISAYASPDGPYDFNAKLADKRKTSAERYFDKTLKKDKFKNITSENFLKLLSTPEDWEGFKKLVEESNIQDKELILRVLSMYSDPAVREKEIKNMAAAYTQLKETILPKLRRAKFTVSIDSIGHSDAEIAELAKTDPDSLNKEEILYAATLTNDMDQKLAIYQAAARHFPNSFRANNNVGYIYMQMGKTDDAKAAFEKAKAIEDNDVIKNNLGAVALKEGDIATAENLFTAAMGAGDVVNYNLGIIKIKQGDYNAAVNYFGNTPSFNAALAQLLNGNTEQAINTLGAVKSDDAMVDYLKAVAGARNGKEDMVLNNLRAAVGKDASLKAYASKDLEFAKFSSSEAFQGIVK